MIVVSFVDDDDVYYIGERQKLERDVGSKRRRRIWALMMREGWVLLKTPRGGIDGVGEVK